MFINGVDVHGRVDVSDGARFGRTCVCTFSDGCVDVSDGRAYGGVHGS